jgi:hypothetical protein
MTIEVTCELGFAAVTVTLLEPDLPESAMLVAVTVSVPALDGAVYMPDVVIVPSDAFHVTNVVAAAPWIVALNGTVPAVTDEAVAGDTTTEVTLDVCSAATVTVAVADFVGFAMLVAIIVPVPALVGAVKTPVLLMVPIEADQATALFVVVPWIAAVNCVLPLRAEEAVVGDIAIEVTPMLGGLAVVTPTHPDTQTSVNAKRLQSANVRFPRSTRIIPFSLVPKLSLFRALQACPSMEGKDRRQGYPSYSCYCS